MAAHKRLAVVGDDEPPPPPGILRTTWYSNPWGTDVYNICQFLTVKEIHDSFQRIEKRMSKAVNGYDIKPARNHEHHFIHCIEWCHIETRNRCTSNGIWTRLTERDFKGVRRSTMERLDPNNHRHCDYLPYRIEPACYLRSPVIVFDKKGHKAVRSGDCYYVKRWQLREMHPIRSATTSHSEEEDAFHNASYFRAIDMTVLQTKYGKKTMPKPEALLQLTSYVLRDILQRDPEYGITTRVVMDRLLPTQEFVFAQVIIEAAMERQRTEEKLHDNALAMKQIDREEHAEAVKGVYQQAIVYTMGSPIQRQAMENCRIAIRRSLRYLTGAGILQRMDTGASLEIPFLDETSDIDHDYRLIPNSIPLDWFPIPDDSYIDVNGRVIYLFPLKEG
jgi:hypothetical protein